MVLKIYTFILILPLNMLNSFNGMVQNLIKRCETLFHQLVSEEVSGFFIEEVHEILEWFHNGITQII